MKSYNILSASQFVVAKFIWFIVAVFYYEFFYFHINFSELSNENGHGLLLFICWIIDMIFLFTILSVDYSLWKRRIIDTNLDYNKWIKLWWIPFLSFYLFFVDSKLKVHSEIKSGRMNKKVNTADLNVTNKQEKFLLEVRAKNEKDSLKVVQKKELEENKSADIEDKHQSFMPRGTILEKETTDEVIKEKIEIDELMDKEKNSEVIRKKESKEVNKEIDVSKSQKKSINIALTKEEALEKLRLKKKLLDLEIITQDEYDKVKDELKSIIISS